MNISINYINGSKETQGKAFERIQYAIMAKILEKGLELTYLNTIKAIYIKSIAQININGGKQSNHTEIRK